MIAPDIFPTLIVITTLNVYNPTITTIFVYQRWTLRNVTTRKKIIFLTVTFVATLVLLLLLHHFFKQEFEVWAILYGLTLTVITIGDRIAERNRLRSNGQA